MYLPTYRTIPHTVGLTYHTESKINKYDTHSFQFQLTAEYSSGAAIAPPPAFPYYHQRYA